jgi:hypothetical protein
MDPSLQDGFRVLYDREVPFEIRVTSESRETEKPLSVAATGTLEAVKVKVLLADDTSSLRVELSSETDLFFHYRTTLGDRQFREIQNQQRLMVDFTEFPSVLFRMLNNCIKEPHTHIAVLVVYESGEVRLDFIQNMEYKFVELLSLPFEASPDDIVRQQITFRYNALKSRYGLLQARLQDISALVKLKNPSLLLQLHQRGASGIGSSSMTPVRSTPSKGRPPFQ